jgi:cell division protein FtsQ
LLRPFLVALLLVGIPVTALAWVATSPRFLVGHVEITGTQRVSEQEIAKWVAPLQGRHLLLLSLPEVEGQLQRNPWIEGVRVTKRVPDHLYVEVQERRPVALVRHEEGLFYVDRSGVLIDRYDLGGPVDLPLLSLAPGADLDVERALELARALSAEAPLWSAGLSEIEILEGGDFRIFTAALPFPVLMSFGGVGRQVRKLRQVLPEILRRYDHLAAVDLRFTRQIVIKPAVDPRSQEG